MNIGPPSTAAAAAAWFAVHTKPREEERALEFLAMKRITAFLPRLLAVHRHGSRRWQTADPLFPGYLFARFSPEPHIVATVHWTPGVRRLLWDASRPTPVPDDAVAYLQSRTTHAGVIDPGTRFHPGMRVRIRRGPLVFLEGIIERPTSRDERVRVLLELLHTRVAVEVDTDDLETT